MCFSAILLIFHIHRISVQAVHHFAVFFYSPNCSLSQTMINSDMLKLFVDFGTGAVNAVDSVAKAFRTPPVIMAGTSAVLGAKDLGRLKVSLNIYC